MKDRKVVSDQVVFTLMQIKLVQICLAALVKLQSHKNKKSIRFVNVDTFCLVLDQSENSDIHLN